MKENNGGRNKIKTEKNCKRERWKNNRQKKERQERNPDREWKREGCIESQKDELMQEKNPENNIWETGKRKTDGWKTK